MLLNQLLFLALFSCFNIVSYAAEQAYCDSYFIEKGNYLFNLSLVGSNNNDLNYKNSDEIFPDNEIEKNGNVIQYFHLDKYHYYKKILLVCVYTDGKLVVKDIPKTVLLCTKKRYSEKNKISKSLLHFNCKR